MLSRWGPSAAVGHFAVQVGGEYLTTQKLWDAHHTVLAQARADFPDPETGVDIDWLDGCLSVFPTMPYEDDMTGDWVDPDVPDQPFVRVVPDHVFRMACEAARFIHWK